MDALFERHAEPTNHRIYSVVVWGMLIFAAAIALSLLLSEYRLSPAPVALLDQRRQAAM